MSEETSPAALKAAAPMPLLYGRYEILEELGRGTSGVVYKARDPKLDRLVAMKILRPELVSLEESGVSLKQRFHQEAVAAGRLTHSAIVAVHDVGEADGRPFMIMEYIEGGTLADLLIGGRPLPLADAVAIVVQVCAALDYAHRHGVVHRDIKPRNILVEDGVTKVTDFGTARILGASHTQTGTMLGTPAYMSPEMVRGQATDPRSDLFSLGVVLYEALTGVNPFNAADLAAVLYRIVNTNAPPLRHHNPALPPGLDRVLRRVLAKEPEARYATATELADALREGATLEPKTWTLRTLRDAAGDLRRIRPRARAAGVVALSLMCLVGLGAGAWAAFRRAPDAPGTAASRSNLTRSVETARPVIPPAGAPADQEAAVAKAPAPTAVPPPTSVPAPAAVPDPAALPTSAQTPAQQALGCLSVNALPFAQIYVDDQPVGYTPKACLRMAVGEHRVRFVMNGQRSPERLVRITARHKPAAPMRLSYDFATGHFIEK
jgi:eukaryotic-like serine/threonine-protein kinase